MSEHIERINPDSWTWMLLAPPKGRPRTRGTGFWGGHPIVYAEAARSGGGPYVYDGANPHELAVDGAERVSFGTGTGEHLAGTAWFKEVGHAVVLRRAGGGFRAIDLHDAAYVSTAARAAAAGIVVGSGVPVGKTLSVALVWKADGGSPAVLDGLEPGQPAEAAATDGTVHGGVAAGRTVAGQAVAWKAGSAEPSFLPAAGAWSWGVAAVAAGAFTGTAWKNPDDCRPSFWPSSSGPWVDLTPAGFLGGEAHGAAPGLQAGWSYTAKDRQGAHAMLWGGSTSAVVDLHPLVDAGKFNESFAAAVLATPAAVDVIGWVGHKVDGRLLACQACRWTAKVVGS